MNAERQRLLEVPTGRSPWRRWGPVPDRAGLGHGARGLQPRRRRLGLLPARPRPLARLPLERGRPGRRSATTSRRCASRSRSGTARDPILKERIFGLTGPRGQPRRGRQGVLVLPRLDADALVDALALPLPAGGVPVRAPGRREPRRGQARAGVRTPRHRASSTTTATGTITVDYAKAAPTTSADPDHGAQRRPRDGDAARAADAVVPQHLVVGPRDRGSMPSLDADDGASGRRALAARPALTLTGPTVAPEALFCDNETNTERLFGGTPTATPYPKDGINDHVVHGARDGQPGAASAPRPRCGTARGSRRRDARVVRLRLAERRAAPRCRPDAASTSRDRARARRPTSSTPR